MPSKRRDTDSEFDSAAAAKNGGDGTAPSETRTTPDAAAVTFPVVAMGASAGGLEAFTTLLHHLPIDTGMAFVMVQHLDPTHESLLVDLLGRSTTLPVEEAREGVKVAPNRIYVIPPNTEMAMRDGRLRLSPRSKARGPHMSIDHFMRSLAEDAKSCAIGVILSGTSTDGALGIAAIKGAAGITFAQDDDSAKCGGMPRAAVATGCVDFVLPPEEIAGELARIAQHPYVRTVEETAEAEAPAARDERRGHPLGRIFQMLRAETSVDFSLYKQTTIRRRIARRMALRKLENLEDYLSFLEQNPTELDDLYGELLIKVTSFFRNPEMFQALQTKVLPEIVRRLGPDSPLRVWVPGCATGEEAYSIAIVLLEYLAEKGRQTPVQVFATDVSDESVEKARAGIYIENVSTDVSAERLSRFFVKREGGYQVSKSVRDLCVFARQNLAKDPPFSKLDLISCRNLLIYLEPVLQKRIIPMFHYALNPQGILLLGGSETVGTFTDLFELTDKRHKLYSKRHVVTARRFDFDSWGFAGGKKDSVSRPARMAEEVSLPDLQTEADRAVLAAYGPAGVIVNDELEVIQYRGKTSPYLEPSPGKASLNLLKMLREGLLLEVRSAIQKARRAGEPVKKKNVSAKQDDGFHEVDFEVIPLQATPQGRHFLILFSPASNGDSETPNGKRVRPAEERQVEQLKQELMATRQYLQSIIEEHEATNEELQSANEEILSSNEELQSINEELETAKEELQSTNEELTTVNEELQNRITELSLINDDLHNLISSVHIAIVILGSDLRIRRFTPAAGKILNLIPTDIGRPITDLRPVIKALDLGKMIGEVLETATMKETDVADGDGRWYSMSLRPYRTSDNRIDGAVMILADARPGQKN